MVGRIRRRLLKSPLSEPKWASGVRAELAVSRLINGVSEFLEFEFVGKGGWVGAESADYLGWRRTGVDLGDADAWLTIYSSGGVVGFSIYGLDITVTYKGVEVSPISGPYVYAVHPA